MCMSYNYAPVLSSSFSSVVVAVTVTSCAKDILRQNFENANELVLSQYKGKDAPFVGSPIVTVFQCKSAPG